MTTPVTPPAAHQGANDTARPKANGPASRRKPGSPEEDVSAGEALPAEGAAEAAPAAEGRAPGDDLEKAAPLAALEGGSAAVAQGSSWMGSIWTWFGVTGAGAAISAFASGKGGGAPAATAAAPVANDLALSGSEDAAAITGQVGATDANGDALTYSIIGSTPAGLSFNIDGTFAYVPQAADQALDGGETRTVTFLYVARDGSASSNTATVTLTIQGANDAPATEGPRTVSGSGSGPVSGSVVATDSEGGALSYALSGATPPGLVFSADGSFTYTPQPEDLALDDGEARSISFDYVAYDGTAYSTPTTVTLVINGVNDAPVATAGAVAGSAAAAAIDGAVSASDVDVEGITYAVTGPTPSGLTFNPDGTFSYAPQAADYALDDGEQNVITFQYVASDGTASSVPATVTITVSGANDAPLSGGAAAVSGTEDDAAITGSVPAASDVDGEVLTYALTAAAPAGLTFNADGTFSYTPQAMDNALDSGETRTVTFDYIANDGTVNSAPATVTITINGVNDAPVSGGTASATGSEDVASISGNVPAASDVDGEALTYALTAAAPAGVVFNSDGTFTVTPQAADQGLDAGESRTITFSYVANDGTANSAPATVTVTITGVNDAPVSGGAASASGSEDAASITGSVPAAGDVDMETLTYTLVGTAPAGVTFNSNGTFSVTPQASDQGLDSGETRTITFDYVANDGTSSSAAATVTVTVSGLNDAPVSGGSASASGSEDAASISGSVPAATDVDGELLTYSLVGSAPAGLTLNSDGSFSYTPQAADAELPGGATRTVTFDYQASDGSLVSNTATATITVAGANDAPVIGLGAATPLPVAPTLIGGEFHVNTTTADHQQVSPVAALAGGGFVVAWQSQSQDGSYWGIYAQRYDAAGVVQGGEFRVNTTTASHQDTPSVAGLAGGGFVVTWVSNAQDGDAEGVYGQRYDESGVAQGSEFRINTTTAGQQLKAASIALEDGGFMVAWMSSDGGNFGIYARRYDASGVAQGVEFRVNALTADNQNIPAATVLADGSLVIAWTTELPDGSSTVLARRVSATGTVQGSDFLIGTGSDVRVAGLADGSFMAVWTGNDGSGAAGIYARHYSAAGAALGAAALVNSTTLDVQTSPAISALQDGGYLVTWASYGQDGSTYGIYAQRYDADGMRLGGEFRVNTTTAYSQMAPYIATLANGDLVVTWTSSHEDTAGVRSFGIYAQRFSADGTPADAGALTEGDATTAVSGQLLASDVDTGDAAAWSITNASAYGAMSIDATGRWTFTLDNNAAATQALAQGQVVTQTFTATVTDAAGATDNRLITITLTGSNDAPVVGAVAVSGSEDAAGITGSVSGSDAEGGALTYSLVGSTPAGLVFNTDGTFSYAPLASDQALRAGQSRAVMFSYKANDGSVDSNTATATITVNGVNDAPVIGTPVVTTPVASGTEFRANTTTTDLQEGASVTALTTGGFVVTWSSMNQDGSGWGVYGQRYDAGGAAVGTEFRVNVATAGYQLLPAVTALGNGGFLVTWQSAASQYDVYGRRYLSDGTPLGGEFLINTASINDQGYLATASLTGGGAIATWASIGQDGSGWGIYGQRFASNGTLSGSEFRINTTTVNNQEFPAVAALSNGGFVVTWDSWQDAWGIYAQRYAANGAAVGAEMLVSSTAVNAQDDSAVCGLSGGGFVVTWERLNDDGSGAGIYGQRFAADGSMAGTEFRINTTTVNEQTNSVVRELADGGFVVMWQSLGQDGSGWGIYGQRFAASGAAVGTEFRINTTTASDQSYPALTVLTDGSLLATWNSSGQDGSGTGVYAMRLSVTNPPGDSGSLTEGAATTSISGRLVVSDIDSGDTHGWSISNASPYGSMSIATDGAWTFTLDNTAAATQALAAGQVVTQTFTATATDSQGASDTHAVTVIITGNNDAPVAVADTASVTEAGTSAGTPVASGNVLGNDVDPDGGAVLTVTAVNGAGANVGAVLNGTYGTLTLNANGTYTYTLDNTLATTQALSAGESLSEVFSYTITDDKGATSSSTLTVTVNGVNDAPSVYLADAVVNTTTANDQQKPAVAMLKDGGYIVVWQDYAFDASYWDVLAQRYDVNGNKVGAEFQVNSYTNLAQWDPDVTALANGGFVITWASAGQDGDVNGVYARIYDAAGTVQSSEIRVNTNTPYDQWYPDITALANGGFAVTWSSFTDTLANGGRDYNVYFQRFAANGTAVGGETVANSSATLPPDSSPIDQLTPEIAGLVNGNFVMVWASYGQDGSGQGIYGRVYNAAGTTIRGEFRLNTTTLDHQYEPSVSALGDGGFVVVWMGAGAEAGVGVYGQRFDATGAAVGTEFHVNTTTAGDQLNPAVTSLAGGGFVVTWQSPDAEYEGIFAQCFDASGAKVGGEFLVNHVTASTQANPDVAGLADGSFVVTWESYAQDGSGYAIVSQRFLGDGTPAALGLVTEGGIGTSTGRLSASDSDSGDSIAWSITNDSPYGTMVIAADGSWTFTLDNNAEATQALAEGQLVEQTFTVTATDSAGASDTRDVTITLIGSNDAPVGVDDSGFTTPTGTALQLSAATLLANDRDAEGDTLTLAAVGNAVGGSVSLSGDTVTFTPNAGFSGNASFSYTLSDGSATATAAVSLTVNTAPVISLGAATALTPEKAGTEFQVNTFTSNSQRSPAMTTLAGGDFVVSWVSNLQDGSGSGIYAQRYNAAGTAVGSEFRINSTTVDNQDMPALAALPNGGFVAVWQSVSQFNSAWDTYARVYNAAGSAVSEFMVPQQNAYNESTPAVTALPDGNFVVSWRSNIQEYGSPPGIYAIRYAGDAMIGIEFRVDSDINAASGDAREPALTTLADGSYVAVWASGLEGSWDIYAQRFSAATASTGAPGIRIPLGEQFRINTTTADEQRNPTIAALADGGFVVVWESRLQDGSGYGIYAQRFDATGGALGSEFCVNATTADQQRDPAIAALADGGFVVSWETYLQDGSGYGIYAQRYDASGAAAGSELRVNTTTADEQVDPALTALADGGFVVSWASNLQDGSGLGVYAQRFEAGSRPANEGLAYEDGWAPADSTLSGQLLASDADTGDTLAWSISDDTPASRYGTITIAADGTWTFTLDNTLAATKALAAGATVTEAFTATVTDSLGATDTQTVTVTIVGAAGDYLAGAEAVNDSLTAGASGDYLDGKSGADALTGGAGSDIFDGGAGDDTLIDTMSSDDLYLYREGAGGFDIITESTDASSDTDVLRILDATGVINFSNVGADLYIQVGSNPAEGLLVKDFFTADQSALNADIEQLNVYSDSGSTLIGSYTSQQIFEQLFP